jgi:hypothetical protein
LRGFAAAVSPTSLARDPVSAGEGMIPAGPPMDIKRQRQASGFANRLFSLVGIVGLFAAVIAGATVWLLLTDPVTVAESMDSGEVTPLVQSLAGSIYDALVKLMKYL